ncbi:MAG: LamG domain-containing protein [Patescibacteria group bacterium]
MRKKIIFLFIIFIIFGGAASFKIWQTRGAATKSGLVGHWAMDKTDISGTRIYDKSGNKNNGTLAGTAEKEGRIKEARYFNGTTDWISIPNSSSLTIPKAVTLSAWIKPNYFNSSSTDYAVIIGKRVSEANYEYQLYTYLTGRLCFAFNARAWDQRFNSIDNLVAGKWQHIVATYNGSRVELYKDGVNFWGTDDVTGLHTSTGNVGIGRRPDEASSIYNGTIDDARIYNRALSDEEVMNLYNSTKVAHSDLDVSYSDPGIKRGLVGWWTFDVGDFDGMSYYDRSGYGYTGTAQNYAPTSTVGRLNQAGEFNEYAESKTYISMGDVLDMNVGDQVTVSAWVKTKNTTVVSMGIVNKWDAATSCADGSKQSYRFTVLNSGKLYASVNSDGGQDNGFSGRRMVNDGLWHHVVFSVKDGANNYNFYVDGTIDNTTTKVGTGIYNSVTPLKIGLDDPDCGGFANRLFHGEIDDVRIYDYALSAGDAYDLYNAGRRAHINAPTKTDLIGLWDMNANNSTSSVIYDISGQRNNGRPSGFQLNSTPTSTSGVIKEALSFDGQNGQISIGNESNFDLSIYTLSAWVKTSDHPPTDSSWTVLAKGSDGPFFIQTQPSASCGSGGELGIGWNNDTEQNICSGIVPSPRQWYYIAAISDGTNVTFYVNGENKGSGLLGTPHQNNFSVSIGSNLEAGGRYWNGAIDDVRIYSRALSAQEIVNIYNAAKISSE